jgi:(p)ppGpp synthase/HD superfamily hydrolase
MIYTKQIQGAIKFSIKTHEVYQKQKRKGKDIAYVTHPLTVGLVLSQAGAKEAVVVAGILHDTIEDSVDEKKVTEEMLIERFGSEVASLVVSVTENDKQASWDMRKSEAREKIITYSADSLLLKSADVLCNTREIMDDHARDGDMVFERFSVAKPKTLAHYLEVIKLLLEYYPTSPLAKDLQGIAQDLKRIA